MTRRLALLCLLVPVLAGCSGSSCDDLTGLRAERDAARQEYAALTASGTATPEQTEQGDAGVHALDRQVHDLEQSCEDHAAAGRHAH